MHSYTMRARGWTERDYGLATSDVAASMLVAFGLYSVAIFLVAASVLSDPDLTTVSAAQALGPLVGPRAEWLFLLGLGGAAVSTLGGKTIVPPFLVADKLGWDTTVEDSRYRGLLAAFALVSALGAFIGGAVLGQLVLVLALGTLGTPFAIAVVLYLLNSGVLDAHAPRLEGDTVEASAALARENADGSLDVLAAAPEPRAVFVNDATIPLQSEGEALDRLTAYCDRAECGVLNAFAGGELGTDDPISRRERAALDRLRSWVDRVHAMA